MGERKARMWLVVNGKRYKVSEATLLRRTQELGKLGRVDLQIEAAGRSALEASK